MRCKNVDRRKKYIYHERKAASPMRVIHEDKGIGVVTETEVVLKNGQRVSLNKIKFAQYDSKYTSWAFTTVFLAVGAGIGLTTLIFGIILGILLFLNVFWGAQGELVIYDRNGGQIVNLKKTLMSEGNYEQFVQIINKMTK